MRFNLNLENDSYKNLETVMTDFEKINAVYQKQKEEASAKFKEAFEAFIKDFFTLVPTVKRVTWTQYTPYFNDGDACTFGVNEPYFYNFVEDEDFEDYENDGEISEKGQWEISSWYLREPEKYGLTTDDKKIMEFLNEVITSNEDFMYDIFGDHQKIVLTADGVESDYYDHD